MIAFSMTEEQQQLQKLARDFATQEIRPRAPLHDDTGEWPAEILQKGWELGLLNTHIPTENEGLGLSSLDEIVLFEELGWGCTGIATAMCANTLAQAPVIVAGNDAQKRKYLVPFSERHHMCSYAVTEPGAGSDVAGIQMTAVRSGDKYVLNGQKMWITGAGYAEWFFVLAKTDKEAGHKGTVSYTHLTLPTNREV